MQPRLYLYKKLEYEVGTNFCKSAEILRLSMRTFSIQLPELVTLRPHITHALSIVTALSTHHWLPLTADDYVHLHR